MDLVESNKRASSKFVRSLEITKAAEKKPYVFISYSSSDWTDVLEKIVYDLQKEYGLRIYFDKNFEERNETWMEIMERNITNNRCVAVMIFLSKNYLSSYATLLEILASRSRDAISRDPRSTVKPIIPVMLGEYGQVEMMLNVLQREYDDVDKKIDTEIKKVEYDYFVKYLHEKRDDPSSDEMYREIAEKLEKDQNSTLDITKVDISEAFRVLIEKNIICGNLNRIFNDDYKNLYNTIKEEYKKYREGQRKKYGCESECSGPDELFGSKLKSIDGEPSPRDTVPACTEAAASETVQNTPVSRPVSPKASAGTKLSYSMTLKEFRDYVADEANTSTLLYFWDNMKKIPGYVVFASLLGGPGISGASRKIFVKDIAKISVNGKPNAGTWSSAVSGCINDSRKLESVKDIYPGLSEQLKIREVRDMFDREVNEAFKSKEGKRTEILKAFDTLFEEKR